MTGRPAPYTLLLPPREAGHACFPLALCCSACRDSGWPFAARIKITRHARSGRSVRTLPRNGSERVRRAEVRGISAWKRRIRHLCKQRLAGTLAPGGSGSQPEYSQPGNRAHDNFPIMECAFSRSQTWRAGPPGHFAPISPPLDLFPTKIWTRLAERRLRRLSMPQLLGCDTMGYLPLRTAVADYLNRSRGTQCKPEQVMIVSGTQEALDLAGRLILNPGDQVCVEEPGYPGAAMAFEALGAKICPVPVDSEGMELPGPTRPQGQTRVRDPWASISCVHDHESGSAVAIAGMGSPFARSYFRG